MSGICSAHRQHVPACRSCRAMQETKEAVTPKNLVEQKLEEALIREAKETHLRTALANLVNDVSDALALAKTEAEANRWIPVAERKPPIDTPVQLVHRGQIKIGQWHPLNGSIADQEITHWRALPPLPEAT